MITMTKKKQVKTRHPCRFLSDADCANPEMEMYSEHCLDPDSTEYYQIPDQQDCIACLLANLLDRMGRNNVGVAFLKEE